MIVTLTLNPAVDRTLFLKDVTLGEIHRVRESQLDPAGKGINVSRMVDRLGMATIAFGLLAGETGEIIARALQDEGVQSSFLRVSGQTRLNVTIFEEATARGTSFFDTGPSVDAESLKALEAELLPWLHACKFLVLAGSLPQSVPDRIYADFIAMANAAGTRVALDAAGEPLALGIRAHPFLLKPNIAEAELLLGRPLRDQAAVVSGAQEIAAMGVEIVVVSRGAQGAICVQGNHVWQAIPPSVKRQSTIGSGDSMVAGLVVALAGGQSLEDALRLGTAAGAATAIFPGTSLGSATDVARLLPLVKVERLS